jgi:uncharacterized protein
MAQRTEIFDLGSLGLHSGEGRSLELTVPIEPFELAGQSYSAAEGSVPVKLDVSHTTRGYALRLRYAVRLDGPCMRCLEDAGRAPTEVDAREIDQPGGGDDLTSPYLDGTKLDVAAWARDALVLALPAAIVCSEDCRGLCAICGENLNTAGPDHAHEAAPDPRWSKLNELKLDQG